MAVAVPILPKAGPLPKNIAFTPAEYRPLLLQRMELKLSGDQVILGSMNDMPSRNVGAWWNATFSDLGLPEASRTPTWFMWDTVNANYRPADIGLKSGEFGITVNAAPTANRIQKLKSEDPTDNGPIALLTDVYVPRDTVIVGTFVDGISSEDDATYASSRAYFHATDAGLAIEGENIPQGTTIASVSNQTTIELSQAATGDGSNLDFKIINRTYHVIDVSRSFDFILTLSGNTVIQPLVDMPRAGKVTVMIINAGTAYTVTWPTAGDDEIVWPASGHAQPVSLAGETAIGIYNIHENLVGSPALTEHLWGVPLIGGFNNTPAGPTEAVPDPYYGSDPGDLPPDRGQLPFEFL